MLTAPWYCIVEIIATLGLMHTLLVIDSSPNRQARVTVCG